jgi:hypothetical protein
MPSEPALSAEDYALLNDLWTTIEQNHSGLQARRVLIEKLKALDWIDAAVDAARELLKFDPTDIAAKELVRAHKPSASSSKSITSRSRPILARRLMKPSAIVPELPVPTMDEERYKLELQLGKAISSLQEWALLLSKDLKIVTEQCKMEGMPSE